MLISKFYLYLNFKCQSASCLNQDWSSFTYTLLTKFSSKPTWVTLGHWVSLASCQSTSASSAQTNLGLSNQAFNAVTWHLPRLTQSTPYTTCHPPHHHRHQQQLKQATLDMAIQAFQSVTDTWQVPCHVHMCHLSRHPITSVT